MPCVSSRLIALANQKSIRAVVPACPEHTIKNEICLSRHIPHPLPPTQGPQRKEGRTSHHTPKRKLNEAKRWRGPSRSLDLKPHRWRSIFWLMPSNGPIKFISVKVTVLCFFFIFRTNWPNWLWMIFNNGRIKQLWYLEFTLRLEKKLKLLGAAFACCYFAMCGFICKINELKGDPQTHLVYVSLWIMHTLSYWHIQYNFLLLKPLEKKKENGCATLTTAMMLAKITNKYELWHLWCPLN